MISSEPAENEITPITDLFSGDSVIFGPFTVLEGGETRDLTDDTFEWYLFDARYESDPSEAVLSHTDAGVDIEKPPRVAQAFQNGQWQVFVEEGKTSDLFGEYWQRAIVDGKGASKQTWQGLVRVTK